MAAKNPTAFISYSWDDESHKSWVLGLASRLVENGVTVKLDQWDVPFGDSLTAFMESSVQNCDFTLVICTPNYAARSLQRKGGVGYEQQIISGQIAAGVARSKFIPLIRSGSFSAGDADAALPPHFLGIHALDMRGDVSDETFEDLLRAIYKAPRLSPPALGRKPEFTAQSTRTNVRLATIEIDGFYLNSGVVSSELYPDTFIIPSEEERQAVKPTDLVKLSFELQQLIDEELDAPTEPEVAGERMWVEVTGHNGPYFTGRLRNQPSSYVFVNPDDENDVYVEKNAPLTFDSEVVFLPEHIIDIQTAEEAEEARRLAGL
jgi:hypothetical protein